MIFKALSLNNTKYQILVSGTDQYMQNVGSDIVVNIISQQKFSKSE